MLHAVFLALAVLVPLAQGPKLPERARDPWVFRSVLDQRPRMVTLALCKDMWVAYDAQNCGLYKCWKGGVSLDGAVYTTVHGAQPTSTGAAYTRGLDGPVWSAEIGGQPAEVHAQWRGYFFHGGRAHLKFELRLPDGRTIDVQETADFFQVDQLFPATLLEDRALTPGMPVLYRSWQLGPVPEGVTLLLALRFDGEHVRQRITGPDGVLMRERFVEEPGEGGVVRSATLSTLPFDKDLRAVNLAVIFAPLPDLAAKPDGAKAADTKQREPKPEPK